MQVQVRPGMTHGVGDRYRAGDIFEATAAEAVSFADKFLPVAIPEPDATHTTAPVAASDMVVAVADLPRLPAPVMKRKRSRGHGDAAG